MITRDKLSGVDLPVCTVQRAAVASPIAIDRSDNERELKALVARVAGGDEHALARLYDSTNRIVYGLALRMLGDSASSEDVTMEVYLQVWRTARNYDPQRGRLLNWLIFQDSVTLKWRPKRGWPWAPSRHEYGLGC